MSLKRYIEMMTPNERSRAASRGQSNLDPDNTTGLSKGKNNTTDIYKDIAKLILKEDYDDSSSLQDHLREIKGWTSSTVHNTTPDFKAFEVEDIDVRIVLFKSGQVWWSYAMDQIHEAILEHIIINNYTMLDQSILYDWYGPNITEALDTFICLEYRPDSLPNKIAPSETYSQDLLFTNQGELKSYAQLIEQKYGLELITDVNSYRHFYGFYNPDYEDYDELE